MKRIYIVCYFFEKLPQKTGFVGSSESTLISIDDGRCQCELLSIDCLNTIECLVTMKDKTPQSHVIYQGMVKRTTIKEMANYIDADFSSFASWYPIGKSFQVISQALFREWMKRNQLWKALGNRHEEPIDDKTFDFCVTNSLQGAFLFFLQRKTVRCYPC